MWLIGSFRYETCLSADGQRKVYRVFDSATDERVGAYCETERGRTSVYPVDGSPLSGSKGDVPMLSANPLAGSDWNAAKYTSLRKAIRATCRQRGKHVLIVRFPQDETNRTWIIVGSIAAMIAALASVIELWQ